MKWTKENTKEYKRVYHQENKERIKEYFVLYHNTKHGKIIRTLNQINQRCYNPKLSHYKYYGAKGIQNYLTYEDMSFLYDRDNVEHMKHPSIDRMYADKDYVIGNCQWLELGENSAKEKRKPVVQKTLEGEVVKIWASMSDACRAKGFYTTAISGCCNGKRKTHKGYRWEYHIDINIEKEEEK